jgi:hypothetical protein
MVTLTDNSLGSRTATPAGASSYAGTNGVVEGHHQINTITFQGAIDSELGNDARSTA